MTASRSRGREEKRPPGKTPVSGIHCVSDAAPPLCVAPCESALRSSSSSSSFAPREDDSSLSLTLPAVRENYNPSARVLLSLLVGRVPCIMSQKRSLMLYRVTITIYSIHPSGKLKLSFDRTTNNSKSWNTRTYTLLDIRPLSLSLHT